MDVRHSGLQVFLSSRLQIQNQSMASNRTKVQVMVHQLKKENENCLDSSIGLLETVPKKNETLIENQF